MKISTIIPINRIATTQETTKLNFFKKNVKIMKQYNSTSVFKKYSTIKMKT